MCGAKVSKGESENPNFLLSPLHVHVLSRSRRMDDFIYIYIYHMQCKYTMYVLNILLFANSVILSGNGNGNENGMGMGIGMRIHVGPYSVSVLVYLR